MPNKICCPFLYVVLGVLAIMNSPCSSEISAQTTVTIDATQRRSIGGVTEIDRTRFFNHHGTLTPGSNTNLGDLSTELWASNGLHTSTGRTGTEFDQFITNTLPEDPNRPSYLDPAALVSRLQGSYRNFVVAGNRWESLRENPNSMFVNAGRSSNFWPGFFRTDPQSGQTSAYYPHKEAYAEFLSTYLEEVVYGSNAFLPIASERFHIELLNEPDLHLSNSFDEVDLATYHRDIAQSVKAVHPSASIGGPGLALTSFEGNNFERWNEVISTFIEIAGGDMDFFSMHPYERYDVQQNGSYLRAVDQSPGRVLASIDLVQNYQELQHGNRIPIAFTEYGSFNFLAENPDGSPNIGNYPRDLQQWDLVRDIKEKMMVFINRPDTVLNATPFVSPRDWRSEVPTSLLGDNVFWEQIANGNWQETIVASLFRALAPVRGEYISVNFDSDDLQAVAFRDGTNLIVMLNNMTSASQQLDLSIVAGPNASVAFASADRVFRSGGQNTFIASEDVTSNYENFTLNGDELAVISFFLDSPAAIESQARETTYFGDVVVGELNLPTGRSPVVNVNLSVLNAVQATLRLSYSRPGGNVEAFDAIVNGTSIPVSATGIPADDGDLTFIAREIDVPLGLLVDGNNEIELDFNGNGGQFGTIAIVVRSLDVATDVPVEFFAFENGEYVSGGNAELAVSDNADLSGRRQASDVQSRVVLEVKGTSPVQHPPNLSLILEASVFARSTVNQTVQFFNFQTGTFEDIGTSVATRFTDSVFIANATGDVSRFVEPNTRCVLARCRFVSPNPRQKFVANVDQVIWTIDP